MSVGVILLTVEDPKLAEIGYFFEFQVCVLFLWAFKCKKIKTL
jgi:hypothetical protein